MASARRSNILVLQSKEYKSRSTEVREKRLAIEAKEVKLSVLKHKLSKLTLEQQGPRPIRPRLESLQNAQRTQIFYRKHAHINFENCADMCVSEREKSLSQYKLSGLGSDQILCTNCKNYYAVFTIAINSTRICAAARRTTITTPKGTKRKGTIVNTTKIYINLLDLYVSPCNIPVYNTL